MHVTKTCTATNLDTLSGLVWHAGQAIVQMARSKFNSHMEYAIKFFMTRKVFEAEAGLYQDKNNSLGKFLPEVCGLHRSSSCAASILGTES